MRNLSSDRLLVNRLFIVLTKSPPEEGVGATLVKKTPASFNGPLATD